MPGPGAAQLDELVDGVGFPLEHRLDAAVGPVRRPARDACAVGRTAQRVAEEDALHPPVRAHPLADRHAGTVDRWPRSRRSTPTSRRWPSTRSPTPRTRSCATAAEWR